VRVAQGGEQPKFFGQREAQAVIQFGAGGVVQRQTQLFEGNPGVGEAVVGTVNGAHAPLVNNGIKLIASEGHSRDYSEDR
jgi:hypothetical protein